VFSITNAFMIVLWRLKIGGGGFLQQSCDLCVLPVPTFCSMQVDNSDEEHYAHMVDQEPKSKLASQADGTNNACIMTQPPATLLGDQILPVPE
jgi:hypothetical protein